MPCASCARGGQQAVHRAARLERAADLQAFELQPEIECADRMQGVFDAHQRRAPHMRADPPCRGLDVREPDHGPADPVRGAGRALMQRRLPGMTTSPATGE
ncbi:MAG TPA: hypothetical protein VME92_02765 [Acetobacteraceae bacterium]|nr:hypothetical protein [Acetobacteraceae bacterium]